MGRFFRRLPLRHCSSGVPGFDPSLDRIAGVNPVLLASGVIANVAVAHLRQFPGGVLGSVSTWGGAVDHDLGVLVRQHGGSKLAYPVGR